MLGALLVTMLLSQGARPREVRVPVIPTEHVEVGPLQMDVPEGWRRTWRFGTSRFDAPDGSAYVLVDTSSTLTPNLDAVECRDKILTNLGGKVRWKPIEIDHQPAGEQVIIETAPHNTQSVITARYVGCDGNTTWSMLFQGDYLITRGFFEVIVRQIMGSVHYSPPPAGPK